MPLLQKQASPLWGIWKIEESGEELLARLDRKEWYAAFLQKVIMEHRRQEWLATRVLLKELLGREVKVDYAPSGMPFLPDEPNLHISISHTKGYAAVLLSECPATGIDIEYVGPRVRKVAARFMSEEELKQADRTQELEALLLYWSGKETVFKALGQQDVDFREHIYLHPFRVEPAGSFLAEERRTPQRHTYPIRYEINSEYVVTYTTRQTSERI